MSFRDILYERADGIARITINRPARLNAFTAATLGEMIDAFHEAGLANGLIDGAALPGRRAR